MTDTTTHDLALARAERDAWQSTCEELHRAIAGANVEIEAHLGRCEAADQRARSFEAALTAEREASRGLVAQVEHWRSVGDAAIDRALAAESARDMAEAARDAHADELRAIRDLAAPGNPQGTVADAVRARLDAVENAQAFVMRERDDARRAQAETTTALVTADRELAKLRAEIAELRARPVLTVDLLRGALDAHGHAALARKLFAHLGPVTLPAQDRAEELCRAYHERAADMDGHMVGRWQYHGPESQAICTEAMRHALTSLGAPPTSPPAARPVFAGVSEDELIRLFYVVGTDGIDHGEQCPPIDISDRNGIRAVLARLEVSLVAPEFLRRIPLYTKHGPGGKGDPGICDAACVKCEAERMFLGAPAREVAPTLVAVSDETLVAEFARAHLECPCDESGEEWAKYPPGCCNAAGIRAVRAKLGAAEVTEERLAAAIREAYGHAAPEFVRAALNYLRATAAKGG